MKNLEIAIGRSISYCEAKGLVMCFCAYADNCSGDEIIGIGFNPDSGYTYINLENSISICSKLGQEVEYILVNLETGEDTLFSDYNEAYNFKRTEINPGLRK